MSVTRLSLVFLLMSWSSSAYAQRFLTLPFEDTGVIVQQGWFYDFRSKGCQPGESCLHSPAGAIDYVKGTRASATWQTFDVLAAADGVACWDDDPGSGLGNHVIIRHDQTDSRGRHFLTIYGHLNKVATDLPKFGRRKTNFDKWVRVKRGDVLGIAGETGNVECNGSNCIHLHFDVRVEPYGNQDTRDPYGLFTTVGAYGQPRCDAEYFWTSCPPTRGNSTAAILITGIDPARPVADGENHRIRVTGDHFQCLDVAHASECLSVEVRRSDLVVGILTAPGQIQAVSPNAFDMIALFANPGDYSIVVTNPGGTAHSQPFEFTVEPASVPTTFFNAAVPNAGFDPPVLDDQGNLYLASTHYSTTCGFGFCGMKLLSVSPNGTLRWPTDLAAAPYLGNDTFAPRGVAVAPNGSLYVQTGRDTLAEFGAASGGAGGGSWPVQIGDGNRRFLHPPLVHPESSMVYVSVTPFTAFDTRPGVGVALTPGALEAWRAPDSQVGEFVFGPGGDVYSMSSFVITRFERVNGGEVCSGSTRIFPLIGPPAFFSVGSPEGLLGTYYSDVYRFDGACNLDRIYSWSGSSFDLNAYDAGRLFGFEYTGTLVQTYDPNLDNLVGLRVADQSTWRQSAIAPFRELHRPAVRVVRDGIAYVFGLDKSDGLSEKLFYVDVSNGNILRRVPLVGTCQTCGIAVASNGTVYLTDAGSTRILKIQ